MRPMGRGSACFRPGCFAVRLAETRWVRAPVFCREIVTDFRLAL
jgi:hypothetical protein